MQLHVRRCGMRDGDDEVMQTTNYDKKKKEGGVENKN